MQAFFADALASSSSTTSGATSRSELNSTFSPSFPLPRRLPHRRIGGQGDLVAGATAAALAWTCPPKGQSKGQSKDQSKGDDDGTSKGHSSSSNNNEAHDEQDDAWAPLPALPPLTPSSSSKYPACEGDSGAGTGVGMGVGADAGAMVVSRSVLAAAVASLSVRTVAAEAFRVKGRAVGTVELVKRMRLLGEVEDPELRKEF